MKQFLFLTLSLILLPSMASALDFYETGTEHYNIKTTVSSEEAAAGGLLMEELYSCFSRITGPPAKNLSPLYVTELGSAEQVHSYLEESGSDARGDFVLLRRGTSGNGELVYYNKGGDDTRRSLIHLALFQYLEACNRETPFWIKAGLAGYLETLPAELDEDCPPPFNWTIFEQWSLLEDNQLKSPDAILSFPEEQALTDNTIYPQAWAFLTYLMNATGEEGRILWDTLTLIRTDKHEQWIPSAEEDTPGAFTAFLADIRKPASKETQLKKIYETGSYESVISYIESNSLDDTWLGPYYRGLVHYDRGLFQDGLNDFRKAGQNGAPEGEVLFSQGLCLWELGNKQEASILLKSAEKLKEGIVPDELNRLLD